jgi:hypothetical protein
MSSARTTAAVLPAARSAKCPLTRRGSQAGASPASTSASVWADNRAILFWDPMPGGPTVLRARRASWTCPAVSPCIAAISSRPASRVPRCVRWAMTYSRAGRESERTSTSRRLQGCGRDPCPPLPHPKTSGHSPGTGSGSRIRVGVTAAAGAGVAVRPFKDRVLGQAALNGRGHFLVGHGSHAQGLQDPRQRPHFSAQPGLQLHALARPPCDHDSG